ncbi:MAG: acetyl-CoA carboxylase biotin carboxyl carrier protein subunit [Prevotella sp.]|nr:acetyl-CoA carboxylase biotin carboxyl carrier protein subunit [Prevotella sp.]
MKKEYKYTINGNKYEVAIADIVENTAIVTVNGEEYQVEMEPEPVEEKKVVVRPAAASPSSESSEPGSTSDASSASGDAVKAPLPGVITEICVNVGDEVQAGDTVVVLEAMKMANNIEAEKAGKITAVCVKQGQTVMEDDALVVIE